jgi:hypothetical protein
MRKKAYIFFLYWCTVLYCYITTDGQSASLSWYQAPFWGLWPDFYYCQTLTCLLIWGALSDERTGLSFTIAAVFTSAVLLRVESRGAHDHILLPQIWHSPNLEDQVSVFLSPRNRVARLYHQALGIYLGLVDFWTIQVSMLQKETNLILLIVPFILLRIYHVITFPLYWSLLHISLASSTAFLFLSVFFIGLAQRFVD